MTVVIDTSVLIDHLRGHDGARNALAGAVHAGELLAGSVLSRTEVLAGMRPEEEPATRALLAAIEWLPVTPGIADLAGEMANRYPRSHPGVDVTDYVIAATARSVDEDLWTRDVKHFPMFPELRSPY